MNDQKFKIGIVGVSGYGGGEVLRLCATHPSFEIVYVAGEGSAGQKLIERFPGIGGPGELIIEKMGRRQLARPRRPFVFCSRRETPKKLARVSPRTRIVDIGGDHRFVEGWTYGLADVWPDKIKSATRVANPGCYPSAFHPSLALLAHKLIEPTQIIIDAKSGAGRRRPRRCGNTFGFAEVKSTRLCLRPPQTRTRPRNGRAAPDRRQSHSPSHPHLIPMTRHPRHLLREGIGHHTAAARARRAFYADKPFVRIVEKLPTANGPPAQISFTSATPPIPSATSSSPSAPSTPRAQSAGQAVQNANLMLGLPETAGLAGAPLWP